MFNVHRFGCLVRPSGSCLVDLKELLKTTKITRSFSTLMKNMLSSRQLLKMTKTKTTRDSSTQMRNTLRLRQLLKTRTFTDECLFRFQYFFSNRPSCPSRPSWPTTIEQRDAHRLTALSISHLSTLHCQVTFNKTIKGRPVLAIFTSIRMEHCTVLKLLHKRVLFSKMRQAYLVFVIFLYK